jgi:succinyl-CoA synthetase beta subunit
LNIHEYQSKQIFKEYGLPVPNFLTANTTEEVLASAKEISDTNWVVKAQVHAGGRGTKKTMTKSERKKMFYR